MTIRTQTRQLPFRPRARLILLLGDQLIRDADIAVFELVKNSYDADASHVTVTMTDVYDQTGTIVIEDNGTGMTWETLTEVWLEPGTDYRAPENADGERTRVRTPKYRRLPLGEKGVGRFAVHKLGDLIRLVTRAKGAAYESEVLIDWTEFRRHRYLADARIEVSRHAPRHFTGTRSGTRVEVTSLRQPWNRALIRETQRAITSICSPFEGPTNFSPTLVVEPDQDELRGLLTATDVLDYALFHAQGVIDGDELSYEYRFRPFPSMNRVRGRKVTRTALMIPPPAGVRLDGNEQIDLSRHKIGKVGFELYIFDRDPQILAMGVSDRKGLREFLDRSGGIRVYRDGIRVYDFGEPGNDWLNLGGLRVNRPSIRLGNNLVVGAVSLGLRSSSDLEEKTNREGFKENDAYWEFQAAVLSAVQQITVERNVDKSRIRTVYSGPKGDQFADSLESLRRNIEERGLTRDLGQDIDTVERDFKSMRDRLLTAAGAGLSLAMVIHEVEKGIGELNKAVSRDVSIPRVRELARHLAELIDGLTYLTRRSGQTKEKASDLVRQALFNCEYRLKYHNIELTNGFDDGHVDFAMKCTRRLIIASLMNLIDNSIYWLDVKKPRTKRIYIGASHDLKAGPAIVVADNGPGFLDAPEFLTEPFISRKPDGMGLGLHLVNEVMKTHRGHVAFPELGDVNVPKLYTGAVVALVFREK